MHLSEILTHLGESRAQYFNAVSPPVIQTSNFVFNSLEEFRTKIADEFAEHIYSRGNNPTVEILRKKIAALEGAEDALIFSSGMAAISTTIIAHVKAGDHIISVKSPYSWTKVLLEQFLPRFGVEHTYVDGRDVRNIKTAIRDNTALLVLESPNSLTFELQDLKACARLARQHGIVTCIDNSYASPLHQRPLDLGIDLSMHTGTKYLNGHSDVVMGVVCGDKERIRKIFEIDYMTLGPILSPHDAALTIRGLRTLPLRLKRSHDSAMKITAYLGSHPKVERVLYPFHPSFAQYELAKKQMKGCGGLFSILLKTDSKQKAEAFFRQLERFLLAVSWGGHESLVMPSVAFYDIPGRENSPLPCNLVRFYIGLEDPDWLIEDLERALEKV
jgi:cystathionine beta-lyase